MATAVFTSQIKVPSRRVARWLKDNAVRANPQKSSFPIFKYLDMLMPHKLVAQFAGLPRHVRWTIISALASLVLLWVFLRVVVGSINHWIDTRGAVP